MPPRPGVILVVGVNGAGKTTSIAKLAHLLRARWARTSWSPPATRSAPPPSTSSSIWAERVGAPIVAHQEGADPAAVAFDAVAAARAAAPTSLIIDTAGRLHTKIT